MKPLQVVEPVWRTRSQNRRVSKASKRAMEPPLASAAMIPLIPPTWNIGRLTSIRSSARM